MVLMSMGPAELKMWLRLLGWVMLFWVIVGLLVC
jgi:hypothetical protein